MPIMSALAAGSNQGLGAVKQTPPPINISVQNPNTDTFPYKAITGRQVHMQYTTRVAGLLYSPSNYRYMIGGYNAASFPGAAAYQYFQYSYNSTLPNYFPVLLPAADGTYSNINLRMFFSDSGGIPRRVGNQSQYLTITGGGDGASLMNASAGSGVINITWTAPTGSVNQMLLYRRLSGNQTGTLLLNTIVSSWSDSSYTPNAYYSYDLLYHRTGYPTDSWTQIASVSVQAPVAPVVTGITASGFALYVSWDWPNANPTSFTVNGTEFVSYDGGNEYVPYGLPSETVSGSARSAILYMPIDQGGICPAFASVTVIADGVTADAGFGTAYFTVYC